MTTDRPDRIPSDYTVKIVFRIFKRTWIHRQNFTLWASNDFNRDSGNDPWMGHRVASLKDGISSLLVWLESGWPVPIPSAVWNHATRKVEVFGDDLLLCSECGEFIPFRDRRDNWSRDTGDAANEAFTTSEGKHFHSSWFLCNWLANDCWSKSDTPLNSADARLIRDFAEARLNAPEFSMKSCGERCCQPTKLRAIRKYEALLRSSKTLARPEVSSWIAEKKKPPKPEKTYDDFVYLVHASGHWKLGVSQNVEQRLRELQTGCPFRVEIVKFWKSEQAAKVERALHRRFAEHRMEGEWFKLPESALTYLKGIDDLDREFLAETS